MVKLYNPTGMSNDIWKGRYALMEGESFEDGMRRVAKQMAMAESPDKILKYEQRFFEVLSQNLFVPGGRILYNSGRPNPQLLNCFVLTDDLDSKEGWGNLSKEMIITSMHHGGCGIDFSDVRPEGADINGQRGVAPGSLELMKLINGNGGPIRAGGARRVALMFSLDLDHTDIEKFLNAKLEAGQLQMANVSVRSKRTSDFIKAVDEDGDWELSWKGRYKKTIKARDLWNTIVTNAYNSAEPGFLNWELIENESNIHYIEKLTTTNPCVTGDTEILTDNGYKQIIDVVDQKINVWNGFEFSEVTPKITGQNQKILRLKFSDGRELKCTPYHKFHISTGYRKNDQKKVEAKDLKLVDKLIKNDFPVIEKGIEKNLDEMYTQGFYSADGVKDRKLIWIYEPKYCVEKHLVGKIQGTEYLNQFGTSRKYFKVTFDLEDKDYVPFETNLQSRLAWLAGLLDGDGCELKEGGFQITSVDRNFLIDLQKLLSTCGVNSKVLKGMEAGERRLPDGKGDYEHYWCNESFRICVGAKEVQNLVNLGLNCKRLKFEKFPNRDASTFNQIVAIEELDEIEEYVYCFTESKRNLGCFAGVVTGQCGEIALSPHDCCCLGHLVLPRFVKNGKVDRYLLAKTVTTGVRFLDNVLSVNHYPLPEMKEKSHKLRRIGLGTTGLADMLALLGYTYGSEESLKFIDDLYKFISKVAYEASVNLAIEKGAFPACKPEDHIKSGYMKRMTKKIRGLVEEYGIRNCAILTQAPTGTVSILSGNCSSGIEPMFSAAYERRYWVGEERHTETVLHPLFKRFMDEGKDVSHFKSARELTAREHMEVQKTIQKHVDNAVSKTINIPEDYPVEEVSKLWLEYLPHLKGTTFYRENTRGYVDENGKLHEPPLVALSLEEAKKRYKEGAEEGGEVDCSSGTCEI